MGEYTNLPQVEEDVLSNAMDAWYIMAAIQRDLMPLLKQFKDEYDVDITITYSGYWGCEQVAYNINGHFGYVWQFNTYKPCIKSIGFNEEPLPDPNEHAVELILEPFLKNVLDKYCTEPIKNLAGDSTVEPYFNHIVTTRGYSL